MRKRAVYWYADREATKNVTLGKQTSVARKILKKMIFDKFN
jgi:hypothetical protein